MNKQDYLLDVMHYLPTPSFRFFLFCFVLFCFVNVKKIIYFYFLQSFGIRKFKMPRKYVFFRHFGLPNAKRLQKIKINKFFRVHKTKQNKTKKKCWKLGVGR